jgi:hypothetical protein
VSSAEHVDRELAIVRGKVVEIGKQVDGRLSELLASEVGRAHAEGVTAGEQSQRDRASGDVRG